MGCAKRKAAALESRYEFLDTIGKEYGIEAVVDEYYGCDNVDIRLVFEETVKDGVTMGRLWGMVVLVGLLCARKGNTDTALVLLDWLDSNCYIPVLFANYESCK